MEGKVVSLHNPKTFCIKFPFSYDTVNKVKTLLGKRWHPTGKYWTAPINDFNRGKLEEWGFTFDQYVAKHSKEAPKALETSELKTKAELRPYQIEGVNWFHQHNGNILLADEQGLGKTVQTISYVNSVKRFPCVIICPNSLKLNWKIEIQKWTGDRNIYVCEGRKPSVSSKFLSKHNWIIINYDILAGHSQDSVKNNAKETARLRSIPSWFSRIKDAECTMMVLDESQNIKNEDSKRTKAVMELGRWISGRACLSGTPISNRPMEFYTTIKLVDPTLFPNKYAFGRRYCGPKNNGFSTTYNGASNLEELHKILTSSFMIRRLKSDVLKDLPDKQKIVVPVSMEAARARQYFEAEVDFIKFMQTHFSQAKVEKAKRAEAIMKLNTLRKMAMQGKLLSCIEWIEDFLESGKKLVVFAWHQEAVNTIMDKFGKIAVKIDGSVNANERQLAVDAFQKDDKIRLFVGNIKAAGTGLTLTAASDTCTIELSWSPADLAQAEDRVHRIGQKNAVCNYYLLANSTIDEYMMNLVDAKQQIISKVMEGEEADTDTLLGELMGQYLKNGQNIINRHEVGELDELFIEDEENF